MPSIEFRFVIGSFFRWRPYFGRYTSFTGFEVSWLGLFAQFSYVPGRRVFREILSGSDE